MISWNEANRSRREASELGRYGFRMAVVLSLTLSLAVVAIVSKRNLNPFWIFGVFAVPLPIAVYFRTQIVQLRSFYYVSALIIILGAAFLFGI